MKKSKYGIMFFSKNGFCYREAEGYFITIDNFNFFANYGENDKRWYVNDLKTGRYVGKGKTLEAAKEDAHLQMKQFLKFRKTSMYSKLRRSYRLLDLKSKHVSLLKESGIGNDKDISS